MKTILYFFGIMFSEAIWSYLCDMSIVKTVSRKRYEAVAYDAGALVLSYTVLAIIAKNDWPITFIVAAILGAVAGTWVVASRKPRKKKKSTKKYPFTTG
jgi:hypothetical protein